MASIKDVAKAAGVGVGTVSRVLNDSGPVKAETREKVLKIIKELDYTPNEVARSFKSQKTLLIGLMVPTIKNPFFAELAYYIEDELFKNGYKMLLCNSKTDSEKEVDYLEMLKKNRVDGIITISYHDYYAHKKVELPLVAIDRYITDKIPHVSSDNYSGGCLAAQKLIEAGCKKVAYLGSAPRYKSSVSNRKIGFIETNQKYKNDYIIYEADDNKEQYILNEDQTISEEEIVKAFINEHPDVDGVFTSSDLYAGAYINQVCLLGKRVPDDIKVIGFDGIQFNHFFKPYLSTIVQPVEAISRYSVKALLALINENKQLPDKVFEVEYRKGETC